MKEIDSRILEQAKKVTRKRPKTVIDHIIEYGSITTEELKALYGYNHPPRAARDVREEGIPLETIKVTGSDGRVIGAYIFGNPDDIQQNKLGGRVVFSKAFKQVLVDKYGEQCAITLQKFDAQYLQIDHRIPYEVIGDNASGERNPEDFMLLSASAQRQKSWACEHCKNIKDANLLICRKCYWAFPETYTHVAMKQERHLSITFENKEISLYNKLIEKSNDGSSSPQDFIKALIKKL